MLDGKQRKKLRSLAHHIEPVVMIGRSGLTDSLIKATKKALEDHELIKVKFIDFKDEKSELADQLEEKTGSEIAGKIGNIVILYKKNSDLDKRKIIL